MTRTLALLAALALLLPAPRLDAQARRLHWPAIDVTAHLDSAGRLLVRERQAIVLSGDWNGPQRRFHLAPGQRFDLTAMTRVDPRTGTAHALGEGDLDAVDEFRFFSGALLRWRSRLPSDPPHANDTLIYVLDFVYERILEPDASAPDDAHRFVLSHDFAFADRDDTIERFTLRLTVDPAWEVPPGFPGEWSLAPLPPGRGYAVTVPVRYTREGRPTAVLFGASSPFRHTLVGALLALSVLAFTRFLTREIRIGRFARLPAPGEITREWLDHHVFSLAPEVAGAAWDDSTAAPEVAATIARLIAERKLSSEVQEQKVAFFRKQVLHLRLLVPRNAFTGHERALVDALFSPGKETTSTEDVRARYRSTGFDPAALIRPFLHAALDQDVSTAGRALTAPSLKPTLALLLLGLFVFIVGGFSRPNDIPFALVAAGATAVYFFTALQAFLWRGRVVNPAPHLLRVLIPIGAGLWAVSCIILANTGRTGPLVLAGTALWCLALVNSLFNIATARQSADRIALRKRLAAAREFFARELGRAQPALLDAWFPWIIGFGLGKHTDRWFRAFGGATESVLATQGTTTSHGGSQGGGWSGFGGGGGFSGAGSSASFAAAVGGMAASVPSPSSSGSGGGGGGGSGGGSSGGGGGGGW